MVDTSTPRTPLGAPTANRKWWCDVDSAYTGGVDDDPTWIGVFGVQEFQDAMDTTLQDDSDFESNGYKSQIALALAYSLTIKLKRATQAGVRTAYDPGQELIRTTANKLGVENVLHVRWYEMEPNGPRVEAYEGFVTCGWSPDGGAMDALSTVTATLTGRGERLEITHPAATS